MRQIIRYSMDMETWGLPGTFPRGVAAQTMPRIVANTTDRVLGDRKSLFPNTSMSRGDTSAAAAEERAEAMKPSPKSRAISAASMLLRTFSRSAASWVPSSSIRCVSDFVQRLNAWARGTVASSSITQME